MVVNDIKNHEIYVSRMNTTLIDKCWWLEYVPDDVDTVLDFGCAEGDLYNMIQTLATREYKYIGIDHSNEMLAKCREKGLEVYKKLSTGIKYFDPSKTILVLNSVVHEILYYNNTTNYNFCATGLMHLLQDNKFRCVAIRDMIATDDCFVNYYSILSAIKHSPYNQMFQEFQTLVTNEKRSLKDRDIIREFLLKYRYKENWERECAEQYLWEWDKLLVFNNILRQYNITHTEYFNIPFISNQVKKDFGVEFNDITHCKMLLIHK